VPDDFFFALDLPDPPHSAPMLTELVTAVLSHAGFTAPAIRELAAVLHGVIADGAAAGRPGCHVRFEARGGELQIVIVRAGSPEWRTTRPLPPS
jgi:hypothetical protein